MVGLAVVQIQGADGVRTILLVVARVDFQANRVINSLQEREPRAVLGHVEHREDGSAPDESALLLVCNVDPLEAIDVWHTVLRVVVVPLLIGWEVDFNWGCAAQMGHVRSWLADLRRYKNVGSKHELVVEIEGMDILREFIPHRSDDRSSMGHALVEEVVEIVGLLVSLVNSLLDDVLDARTLKPWLSHLVCLASVGTEEREEDGELVELDEEVIIWDAVEAWNVSPSEYDSSDS